MAGEQDFIKREFSPETEGFSFVAVPYEVSCSLPVEIAPRHFFKKANEEQIHRIKHWLKRYTTSIGIAEFRYEMEPDEPDSLGKAWRRLEPSKWKYHILTFDNFSNISHPLELAAGISETELELFSHFYNNGDGGFPGLAYAFFSEFPSKPAKVIGQPDLIEIGHIHEMIEAIKEKHTDIIRAIEMLDSLRLLPPQSTFKVLGMFAIIESLLTHRPKPSDTGDSLTRQIRTKIPLLSRRFTTPINYSNYFEEISEDKVWTLLYDYRSKLAHGGRVNFFKELKPLKNEATALSFLKSTTKALLRHAVQEPDLCMDLREC